MVYTLSDPLRLSPLHFLTKDLINTPEPLPTHRALPLILDLAYAPSLLAQAQVRIKGTQVDFGLLKTYVALVVVGSGEWGP